jgi:hypothetical protein
MSKKEINYCRVVLSVNEKDKKKFICFADPQHECLFFNQHSSKWAYRCNHKKEGKDTFDFCLSRKAREDAWDKIVDRTITSKLR